MAKESEGRTYFESLEHCIAVWGKWKGESWRVEAATAALAKLIEAKGLPSVGRAVEPSVTPFYMPAFSKQYVSVTWHGEMGLQVQRGFMQATVQLDHSWVPAERDVPESQQGKWFVYKFPDHVEFGRASEKSSIRRAECARGCSAGETQPVGSNCPYCDDLIVAP